MWGTSRFIFNMLAALALTGSVSFAQAATPVDAVRALGADLGQAAEAAQAQPAEAAVIVGKVLDDWFDLRSMARSALPQEYRAAADESYFIAYRDSLAREFVKRTLRAGDGELNPVGTRPLGPLTLVGTQVLEDGRLVRMTEFYMRPVGPDYRVNNIAVEGVLVTAQQQKDFRPVLISGDMPALIDYLNRQGR